MSKDPPRALNKSSSTLVPRAASAVLSRLLDGPSPRGDLSAASVVSEVTISRALSLMRNSGIVIDAKGGRGCGCVYSLRDPEGVRDRLAGALRLSLGDLIAAGGVSPAVGVGLLIEAGAL